MEIKELYQLYLQHNTVQTDTRNISKGALFFALKGPNFNGNHFVHQALEAGAAYCIADEPQKEPNPKIIVVPNSLACLQALALQHRQQFNIPVIAITGSNGKTTSKELLQAVLSKKYACHTTKGNLNNHIGIPLTLLSMPLQTEIAVIEMGANHLNEISDYCKIAQPNYGLITNCGKAHLEGFGSEQNVIKGKTELYQWLKENDGTVFINNDYDYLLAYSSQLKQVISYGTGKADVVGTVAANTPYLTVAITKGASLNKIETKLVGEYNLPNILAAVCVAKTFKVADAAIKEALENYEATNSRSQWVEKDGNHIILDAYNANPTSMKAAIENFAAMPFQNKVLVLGTMMELGAEEAKEHDALISLIKKYPWTNVLLAGKGFKNNHDNYLYFDNSTEIASWLKNKKLTDTYFLIKGSRSMKMEDALK